MKRKDLWRSLVVALLALNMGACGQVVGFETQEPSSPAAVTETYQLPLTTPTLEPTSTSEPTPTPTSTPEGPKSLLDQSSIKDILEAKKVGIADFKYLDSGSLPFNLTIAITDQAAIEKKFGENLQININPDGADAFWNAILYSFYLGYTSRTGNSLSFDEYQKILKTNPGSLSFTTLAYHLGDSISQGPKHKVTVKPDTPILIVNGSFPGIYGGINQLIYDPKTNALVFFVNIYAPWNSTFQKIVPNIMAGYTLSLYFTSPDSYLQSGDWRFTNYEPLRNYNNYIGESLIDPERAFLMLSTK